MFWLTINFQVWTTDNKLTGPIIDFIPLYVWPMSADFDAPSRKSLYNNLHYIDVAENLLNRNRNGVICRISYKLEAAGHNGSLAKHLNGLNEACPFLEKP